MRQAGTAIFFRMRARVRLDGARTGALVFSIWTVVGLLTSELAILALERGGSVPPMRSIILANLVSVWIWTGFTPAMAWMARRFPPGESPWPRWLLPHLAGLAADRSRTKAAVEARLLAEALRADGAATGAGPAAPEKRGLCASMPVPSDPLPSYVPVSGLADDLEQRLSRARGAASDPKTRDVPPGFEERMAALGASPSADAIRAEQDRLTHEADRLFAQLGSADNEVVQRARRRQICTIVNAHRRLEALPRG